MEISGTWKNEFGSVMEISVDANGLISGIYNSSTGSTGVYRVTGFVDTKPDGNSQCISFSISWRPLEQETPEDCFHWVSAFAGQFQVIDGEERITTTYLLAKNTKPSDNWEATAVDKAIFKRFKPSGRKILFDLERGKMTDNGATPWYATIGLGTPAQYLRYMVDTGTTHSWVTSDVCTTEACRVHHSFRPAESSTNKKMLQPPKKIDFGPWGKMIASLCEDYLTLTSSNHPLPSIPQPFRIYLSDKYTGSQFRKLACDGGLAIPRLLPRGIDSSELLPSLKAEGVIDEAIVSFWFDTAAGRGCVCLGAVETGRFQAETANRVAVTPLPFPYDYLWTIPVDAFLCNGKPVKQNLPVVLDSGSSFFKGDPKIIDEIVFAITRSKKLPHKIKGPNPDFSKYPEIGLQINGVVYPLKPEQYFVETEPNIWELAFQEMDLPCFIVAGSVFLDTVYSAFYYQTEKTCVQEVMLAAPLGGKHVGRS